MPDNPPNQTPSEPAYREKTPEKKTTTRIIAVPPEEVKTALPAGDSPASSMPENVSSKPSSTSSIPVSGKSSPPTVPDKKDTTPMEAPSPATDDGKPKSATTPLTGIQQRSLEGRKSETIRISLTDIFPQSDKPVDGKRATTPIMTFAPEAAPDSSPIQPKRPSTVPINIPSDISEPPPASKTRSVEVPAAARPAGKAEKKGTTRLILDATTPPVDSSQVTSPITVVPQTIRLKRPGFGLMSAPSKAKAKTKEHTDTISDMPTVSRDQSKTATSRVLVEETLPVDDVKPGTSPISIVSPTPVRTPQTIRLKRPLSTGMEDRSIPSSSAESPTVQKSRNAETAKIDLTTEAEAVPITQRKTIKIKRTERNVAPRTVKLKYSSADAAKETIQPQAVEEEVPVEAAESSSPLFFGLAVAAMVLIGCLVYVMAAQAFGPELVLPVPASLL